MSSIANVLGFSWAYIRPYWGRLVASILLGAIFAVANASFMWAAHTLAGRWEMSEPGLPKPPEEGANKLPGQLTRLREQVGEYGRRLEAAIDPWLPRVKHPLDWRQIAGILLFLPTLVGIRATADYLNNYLIGWVSERVVRDMRLALMTKFSTLSLDFFNSFKTGDLLTRINSDTQTLLRSMRVGGADVIKETFTITAVFVSLCWLDWKLTVCALVLLPALLIPLFVLGKKARRATRAGLKASVSQSSQLVELLASIRVVKAFGLEEAQLNRFRKTSQDIVHAGMKGVKAKELVNPIIEVVAVVGICALLTRAGYSTVMQISCRDRNRIAIQGDVLGAAAMGVRNILCLTGDGVQAGDQPGAKPVFDLDSTSLLGTIRAMRDEARFLSGRKITVPPRVLLGAAENPFVPPYDFRPYRLAKKIAAGAQFIQTQYCFDVPLLRTPEALAARQDKVKQNGKLIFQHAVRRMAEVSESLLKSLGLTPADVDLLVPHQANVRMLQSVGAKLGLPPEKVIVALDRHGNTSAASIPLALDVAQSQGKLRQGQNIALTALGAGLTWGCCIIHW